MELVGIAVLILIVIVIPGVIVAFFRSDIVREPFRRAPWLLIFSSISLTVQTISLLFDEEAFNWYNVLNIIIMATIAHGSFVSYREKIRLLNASHAHRGSLPDDVSLGLSEVDSSSSEDPQSNEDQPYGHLKTAEHGSNEATPPNEK